MKAGWTLIGATVLALALPGAAGAASVTFSGDVLTYTAGTEDNNVSFQLGTEDYACTATGVTPCLDISEVGGGIQHSADCVEDGFSTVECRVPSTIIANMGGGDDYVHDWDGPSTINGGAGNEVALLGNGGDDTINGDAGNDGVFGGDGNDTLNGGDGDDYLEGFGGLSPTSPAATGGTDVYNGGPGKDFLDYGERTESLTITLNGAKDDGAPGEGDTIGLDVEQVRGGNGADTMIGSAASNWLDGFGGNDTVRGGAGEDSLFGGDGDDATFGEDGQDTIEGGDGNDNVDGGAGIDKLFGDEVQVCIPSDCASGQDTIAARDGVNDDVACGPGEDTAVLDAGDAVPGEGSDDFCERVDRSAATGGGGGTGGGGSGTGAGGGSAADLVVPQIQALRAGKFRRGRAIRVRYSLSEAATVTFTVQRRVKRRWVRLRGSIRKSAAAGDNVLRFSKLKKRRLKPGRYRLTAVARDAAGNQAPPKRVALRIVR